MFFDKDFFLKDLLSDPLRALHEKFIPVLILEEDFHADFLPENLPAVFGGLGTVYKWSVILVGERIYAVPSNTYLKSTIGLEKETL